LAYEINRVQPADLPVFPLGSKGIKKLDYKDANEAYAYLVGWAANSIYK